ncbi:MAG: hypothetical protein IKK43_03720 [Clostridia bacterium]|nr:hypothetical protein [Clostridia bacterium]
MKNINILKKAMIYGVSSGCIVFITGFLTMYFLFIQWQLNNPDSILPGLFHYKAAYIGDPICLPLLTGSLFYHHTLQEKDIFQFGKISIITSIIAFITSSLMQIEWLINDKTKLNWTIPRANHFNIAGWYHAFFFVIMITVISTLIIEYIFYSKTKPSYLSDIVIYFSIIFFSLLHFIDDYINHLHPIISLISVLILFLIIAVIIKVLQLYKLQISITKNSHDFIPLILGGILAFVFSIIAFYQR